MSIDVTCLFMLKYLFIYVKLLMLYWSRSIGPFVVVPIRNEDDGVSKRIGSSNYVR